jgi:hypothetical protein
MLCQITAFLDQFYGGMGKVPQLQELVAVRNRTQHALCSLQVCTTIASFQNALESICRIALFIYSDLRAFPLPEIVQHRS